MDKRAQGRPSRAAGIVGRQKIVDDIRVALRSSSTIDSSRKGLAQAIGITPALITYYFPERDALLEEVAVPVVEGHRIKLAGIVNRPDRTEQKLRDIISVLYELYSVDKRLFDMYKVLEDKFPEDYAETQTMTSILADFFNVQGEISKSCSLEAVVLQGAVRRMCEFAASVESDSRQAERTTVAADPVDTSSWRDSMCSFFAALGPFAGRATVAC